MKYLYLTLGMLLSQSIYAQMDSAGILKPDSAIYYHPEVEASYPGGPANWQKYLRYHFFYPEDAMNNDISGIVYVGFVVEVDGSTHDFTVISGPKALRAESLKLYRKSGHWLPAKHNGKDVKSYYVGSAGYFMDNK